MTKEEKQQKIQIEGQKKLQEYFAKLDKIKEDNEFRKKCRLIAIQSISFNNLAASQGVKEAEVIYQWLIKVIK